MRTLVAFFASLLLGCGVASAQHDHTHLADRSIDFPDVDGYLTLSCDFHMHTVFSDGNVWPSIRVEEALRDGLDCIAITDHIEYQPHAEDIPNPDLNRSFDVALASVRDQGLIVIRGTEITRRMPPGHSNAIFVEDVNRLTIRDSVEVFREAVSQGAFTFWNHPNWTPQRPDGKATLTDLHRELIEADLLHGIEVVNDVTYSDEALQIAIDHELTIIGTSDIHGLVDWQYRVPEGGHRPVTLLFATERSEAGIEEALRDGRTAVWFNDLLIGRQQHLVPLVDASLGIVSARYLRRSSVLEVGIQNSSDAAFILRNRTDFGFHSNTDVLTLEPRSETLVLVKTGEPMTELDLVFEVLNAVTAPNTHPEIVLRVDVQPESE